MVGLRDSSQIVLRMQRLLTEDVEMELVWAFAVAEVVHDSGSALCFEDYRGDVNSYSRYQQWIGE